MSDRKCPVSIIIPCLCSIDDLEPILFSLYKGIRWPSEILLIDSGSLLIKNKESFDSLRSKFDINFASIIAAIFTDKVLYPGAARNEGCRKASQDWIAFLDVNTTPSFDWLSEAYQKIQANDIKIIFGNTRYIGTTISQRIFIRATYGERSVTTVPGTFLHSSTLNDIGLFLPNIRAGEDTDWLLRAQQFGYFERPRFSQRLTYKAIPTNIYELSKKWYRNYRSCSPVVFHLDSQKLVYFIATNSMLLFLAFNWNTLMAEWDETSFLYLANVTKLTLLFLVLLYSSLRGLIMPIRRGTKLSKLIPIQWLAVSFICLILDISKLIAFLSALIFPSKSESKNFLCRYSSENS